MKKNILFMSSAIVLATSFNASFATNNNFGDDPELREAMRLSLEAAVNLGEQEDPELLEAMRLSREVKGNAEDDIEKAIALSMEGHVNQEDAEYALALQVNLVENEKKEINLIAQAKALSLQEKKPFEADVDAILMQTTLEARLHEQKLLDEALEVSRLEKEAARAERIEREKKAAAAERLIREEQDREYQAMLAQQQANDAIKELKAQIDELNQDAQGFHLKMAEFDAAIQSLEARLELPQGLVAQANAQAKAKAVEPRVNPKWVAQIKEMESQIAEIQAEKEAMVQMLQAIELEQININGEIFEIMQANDLL